MKQSSHPPTAFWLRLSTTTTAVYLLLGATNIQAAGPTIPLYVTAPSSVGSDRLYKIQGSSFISAPQSGDPQGPIAVTDAVRTIGNTPPGAGAEYTLDTLTPTGTTYINPLGSVGEGSWITFDGATDGVHNFLVANDQVYPTLAARTASVFQLDLDWSNPVELFTSSTEDGIYYGITYDPTDNTFWLSRRNDDPDAYFAQGGNVIEHWTFSGAPIGQFSVASSFATGVALDPIDQTLWVANRSTQNNAPLTLEQYSKAGVPLNSETYDDIFYNLAMGLEFQVSSVPEPATWLAALLAVASLFFGHRYGFWRKRRHARPPSVAA